MTTPHDNDNDNRITTTTSTNTENDESINHVTTTIDPNHETSNRTVQVNDLPLEWTQLGNNSNEQHPIVVRYPMDVADISMDEVEICIVGTAGQKITHIGKDFSQRHANQQLHSLILRSHLIRTIEGISSFKDLQLLELYDNQIESLDGLQTDDIDGYPGKSLHVLDMSYNMIRDMDPVSLCPNLQELYLANNKLRDMRGLKGLHQLRKIDLGANRIRVMDGEELSGLINLEELWLGKNKIEQILGLENLVKLRRLDVQSNRLTTVENLTSQCETLEELYLAHNAITTEGASISTGLGQNFTNLSVLDLSRNRLTTCHPFMHLISLEELWLSGNKIASFDDVQPIANVPLETIYLEYNPLQDDPLYRKKLAQVIPSLKQIDANLIHPISYTTTATKTKAVVPPVVVETEEQRIRRLQDMVIARAEKETFGKTSNRPSE